MEKTVKEKQQIASEREENAMKLTPGEVEHGKKVAQGMHDEQVAELKAKLEAVSPPAERSAANVEKGNAFPPSDHIMQFFVYDHLPPHLQEVSMPFCSLATALVEGLPRNPERTVALRKLLEAKDAAVRAATAK